MIESALIFLGYLGVVFVLIAVHEFGHYLAGCLGGIPAGEMRIRLLTFPQHVVIKQGEEWVSPMEIDKYIALVWEHLKTKPKVYFYVAGGFLMETLFTIALGTGLILAGHSRAAFALVGLSSMILLPWLILEPIMICRGRIFGDLSGLWFLRRLPTLAFIVFLIASRAALLYWTDYTQRGHF